MTQKNLTKMTGMIILTTPTFNLKAIIITQRNLIREAERDQRARSTIRTSALTTLELSKRNITVYT